MHTVQLGSTRSLGSTYIFQYFLKQRLPTSENVKSQEPICKPNRTVQLTSDQNNKTKMIFDYM